ncbi:MAG: phage tail sheath C-terminal domain-containing protein [Caldimonas sp.]
MPVIAGVSTSVALFIGWSARGPVAAPARLRSFADHERQFGPLDANPTLGYALKHFFDNGGAEALALRVAAADARTAGARLGGLRLSAISPGEWAHAYRVRLTRRADDAKRFRIEVLHKPSGDAVVEQFDDLWMGSRNARFVERIVNAQSALVAAKATGTRAPTNATVDLGSFVKGADGARIGPGDPGFHAAVAALFGAGSVTDRIDLFNLVCVAGLTDAATIARVQADCRRRLAFLIVDAPQATSVAALPAVASAVAGPDAMNSALYFPWLHAADPLAPGGARDFPPSGAVTGIYARCDATRGVAKAPAGAAANVHGALALATTISDVDAARLGGLGINGLRIFPSQGILVWGARTLQGSDDAASEWKYVSVRRLALFIEESISRGLAWAAFEANGEPLWATIRASIGAFMNVLWREGALFGQTPAQAYFVTCDGTTTTAADIGRGVIGIRVGFAPIKPAEFIVLAIEQRAAAAS